MGTSGVPEVVSGVDVGFTDFSEFSVGSGIPAGLTQYGDGNPSPGTNEIDFDAVEGNFFSMDGQGFNAWGFGYDAFDGLMDLAGGELLARVFLNVPVNGRKMLGPAANMVGFGAGNLDCWSGGPFRLDPDELTGIFSTSNSSSSNAATGNMQEAWQDGEWLWVRARRVQSVADPGADDDWTVRAWHGDIADEPASPDATNFDQPRSLTWADDAIGWAMPGNAGAFTEQRIAYLSFSADPDVVPPPIPFVKPPPGTFPRDILPERVTSLATPGAVKRRTNAGLIQIRSITAIGWSWEERFGLLRVTEAEHMELMAFVQKAWHSGTEFFIRHPMQPGSGIAPNGLGTPNIMVAGAGQVGAAVLTDGWPVSTLNCVVVGDVISIDGEIAVYMVTETKGSDASGEVRIKVNPPLRTSPADNAIVKTTDVDFVGTIMGRSQFEPTDAPTSYGGYKIRVEESLL